MIEEQPIEIINEVFKYVTINDAFHLGLTNKLLSKIYMNCRNNIFWNSEINKLEYLYLIKNNMKIIKYKSLQWVLEFDKNILTISSFISKTLKKRIYKKKVRNNKNVIIYYFNSFLKTIFIGKNDNGYSYYMSFKKFKLFIESLLTKKKIKENKFDEIFIWFLKIIIFDFWNYLYKIYLIIDNDIDNELLRKLEQSEITIFLIIIRKKIIEDFNYKTPYDIFNLEYYREYNELEDNYYYNYYLLFEEDQY